MGKKYNWKGSTAEGDKLTMGVDSNVKNLVITNISDDTLILNIYIKNGDQSVRIIPIDLELEPKQSFVENEKYLVPGDTIIFTVNKRADFFFSIEEYQL
jgi:archaellum component FlaF (FlaF/FlaG flagellin family)